LDGLAKTLSRKFKQPPPVFSAMFEDHKKPKGEGIKTFKIMERA
jgi:hypothetical protein